MSYMRDAAGVRLDSIPVFDAGRMAYLRTGSLPAGLGWPSTLAPVAPKITESLNGDVYGDAGITPEALFDRFSTARSAPAATYYVSASGADTNAGTSAAPFRSLWKAVDAASAGGVPATIFAEYGSYSRGFAFVGGTNNGPTVDMAIIATDGGLRGGRQLVTGLWDPITGFVVDATQTNTYSKAVANCTRVIDLANFDRFGNAVELTPVPTAALCNITPDSWALVAGTLYIRRRDGAAPSDTNTKYYRDSPHLQIRQQVNVYLEGFALEGSGSVYNVCHVNSPATTTPGTLNAIVAKNCAFRYGGPAAATNGKGFASVNWYGFMAAFNCVADANANDGFGMHNPQNGPAYLLTVNCKARNNGRNVQSTNGFTIHESVIGLDIAGDYEFNHGGNIHDIDNSKAYLLGTRSKDDLGDAAAGGGIPAVAVRVAGSAQVWAERVRTSMQPGLFDYQAAGSTSAIHRRNCAVPRNPDTGPGTFDTF